MAENAFTEADARAKMDEITRGRTVLYAKLLGVKERLEELKSEHRSLELQISQRTGQLDALTFALSKMS
jgi:hypothetical protein